MSTRPAWRTRWASSSNSVVVSWISWPPRSDRAPEQLELDVPGAQAGVRGPGCGAQLRPDPGRELAQRERLAEVVDGAGLEAPDPILHLAEGGEDDHRELGAGRPQLGQDGVAVELGQQQVEHDQVDGLGERQLEPPAPVGGGAHGESVGPEPPLDEVGDPRLVLDRQDERGGAVLSGRTRPHATRGSPSP